MKKVLGICLSFVMALFVLSASAQTQYKGTVVDELGQPVIGATVIVKGTTIGTTTGVDGDFVLPVPDKALVQISFIGYVTEEISDLAKTQIVLKEDRQNIEEVVVVGYGTQKKATLTGSVATVPMDDIQDLASGNLASTLSGLMTGVSVSGGESRPGESAKIYIRNANDLSTVGVTAQEPLYVIDGYIYPNDVKVGNTYQNLGAEAFNNIDPSMIETISVLKDASAAVYGSRAANGVILVTTKKGKLGTPQISYSGSIGIADTFSHPDMLNAYQYGKLYNAVAAADPMNTNLNKRYDIFQADELAAMKGLDYNLLEKYWDAAVTHKHSVNLSGATEKANYFAGVSYFNQGGNLGKLDYDRWSYRAGIDVKIGKGLSAGMQLSGDYGEKTTPFIKVGGSGGEKDYNLLMTHLRHIPEYVDGKAISAYGISNEQRNSDQEYHFAELQNNGDYSNTMSQNFNIGLNLSYDFAALWKPLQGLTARVSYSKSISTDKTNQVGSSYNVYQMKTRFGSGEHLYTPTSATDPETYEALMAGDNFVLGNKGVVVTNGNGYKYKVDDNGELTTEETPGFLGRTMTRTDNYQMNFQLNYARTFGKHSVGAMFSIEKSEAESEYAYVAVSDPYPFGTGQSNSTASTVATEGEFKRYESGSLSYLGRVNYSYDDKYLFEFLLRTDASTKFAPDNYWGYFPSASIGWVVSKENWFADNVDWVDFLKIRASFGLTGRDNLTAWQWQRTYAMDKDKGAIFGDQPGSEAGNRLALNKNNAGVNPDAHWDKSYKMNVGIDWNVLQNRLGFTIEGYKQWDREMLMPYKASIPGTVGNQSAYQNMAEMDSWGIEFSANWRDQIGKDFKYRIGINTGYSDNKVLLMDWATDHTYRTVQKGDRTDIGTWGMQCLGMFRSFQEIEEYFEQQNITSYMGMVKDQVRPGMLIYKDVRGAKLEDGTYAGPDGKVDGDEDQVRLSNRSNPYGLTANLSAEWKGLSLTAQISASWGGYSFIPSSALKPTGNLEYCNMPSFWNPDNMFVYQDVIDGDGNVVVEQNREGYYPNLAYSNVNAVNSSFWRISGTRVRLNRLTLAYSLPKKWLKPIGISAVRVNVTGQNICDFYNPYPEKFMDPMAGGYGSYPTLRKFTIGLNVTF
ncbi:MAG: TonB-dependent receptor [Rikenellaceae bacterium]|nr:TonB-dependent receptor [Rikenellaceae bacterium]